MVVLEKGPWLKDQDFYKDELACCRRSVYTPELTDEQHVIEDLDSGGNWSGEATADSGWDFWNGNCVGGSSNFMSGFFYRLKPVDFHLLSEFGPIAGANVADWPIGYDDLEPYYTTGGNGSRRFGDLCRSPAGGTAVYPGFSVSTDAGTPHRQADRRKLQGTGPSSLAHATCHPDQVNG